MKTDLWVSKKSNLTTGISKKSHQKVSFHGNEQFSLKFKKKKFSNLSQRKPQGTASNISNTKMKSFGIEQPKPITSSKKKPKNRSTSHPPTFPTTTTTTTTTTMTTSIIIIITTKRTKLEGQSMAVKDKRAVTVLTSWRWLRARWSSCHRPPFGHKFKKFAANSTKASTGGCHTSTCFIRFSHRTNSQIWSHSCEMRPVRWSPSRSPFPNFAFSSTTKAAPYG